MIDEKKPPTSERLLPILGRPGIEPLLDSQAAAALLGVHPRTLQRMVLRGEIAGVHVGKLWRFRPSAIDQWIERQLAG
jgi:excisionase family DNA binding protein